MRAFAVKPGSLTWVRYGLSEAFRVRVVEVSNISVKLFADTRQQAHEAVNEGKEQEEEEE
jgi:hypothetical protein